MSELIEAAKAGDAARARRILTASPAAASAANAAGETPLMAALYRGHQDLAGEIADAAVAAGAALDVFAAAALGRAAALDAALDSPGVSIRTPTTAGRLCTSRHSSDAVKRRTGCSAQAPR